MRGEGIFCVSTHRRSIIGTAFLWSKSNVERETLVKKRLLIFIPVKQLKKMWKIEKKWENSNLFFPSRTI